MNNPFQIKVYEFPFDEPHLNACFEWWVEQTEKEVHMISETSISLRQSALIALFAFKDEAIVGAADIFQARTKNGQALIHNGKRVVELGSNVVIPKYRRRGLGRQLVGQRLIIAKARGWLAVSVTTNPYVHKIFKELNAATASEDEKYQALRRELCLCVNPFEGCPICPFSNDGFWVFP